MYHFVEIIFETIVVQVGYGIMAYRYRLRPDIFDYSLQENTCFCNVSNSCQYNGMLDVSSCPTSKNIRNSLFTKF